MVRMMRQRKQMVKLLRWSQLCLKQRGAISLCGRCLMVQSNTDRHLLPAPFPPFKSTPKDKSMNPFCNYAPNSVPKLYNYHGLVTTPLKSYIDLLSLYFPTLNYNYLYDPSIRLVTFPFQQKHKVQELPASCDWMAISNEMHMNSLNQYQTMFQFYQNYPVFAKYIYLYFYSPSAHSSLDDRNPIGTHHEFHFRYKKENARDLCKYWNASCTAERNDWICEDNQINGGQDLWVI